MNIVFVTAFKLYLIFCAHTGFCYFTLAIIVAFVLHFLEGRHLKQHPLSSPQHYCTEVVPSINSQNLGVSQQAEEINESASISYVPLTDRR